MAANTVGRRTLIRSGALGLTSLALNPLTPLAEAGPDTAARSSDAAYGAFEHRGYLGWITDLATDPDPEAAWPSMRLDEKLLQDYSRTFEMIRRRRRCLF